MLHVYPEKLRKVERIAEVDDLVTFQMRKKSYQNASIISKIGTLINKRDFYDVYENWNYSAFNYFFSIRSEMPQYPSRMEHKHRLN